MEEKIDNICIIEKLDDSGKKFNQRILKIQSGIL